MHCLNPSRRKGLTLVEVVVSIALLSILLVSMVSINRQHTRQIRLAKKKQVANQLLDQLLGEWFQNSEPLPKVGQGVFETSGYFWNCKSRPGDLTNAAWKTSILQVDVFHQDVEEALATVELLHDELVGQGQVSQ